MEQEETNSTSIQEAAAEMQAEAVQAPAEEPLKIEIKRNADNDKRIAKHLAKLGITAHLAPAEDAGKYGIVIDWWKQWRMPVKIDAVYVDTIPRELPAVKTEADAVLFALERFGWSKSYVVKKEALDKIIAEEKSTFSIDDVPCEQYLFFDFLKAKVLEV